MRDTNQLSLRRKLNQNQNLLLTQTKVIHGELKVLLNKEAEEEEAEEEEKAEVEEEAEVSTEEEVEEEEADSLLKMEINSLMRRERIEEKSTRIIRTRDGKEKLPMVDSLISKVDPDGEDIITETKMATEEVDGETRMLRRESLRTNLSMKLLRESKKLQQERRKKKLQLQLKKFLKNQSRKKLTTRLMLN